MTASTGSSFPPSGHPASGRDSGDTAASGLSLSFHESMRTFGREEWNRMADGATPFQRWEWLDLMERSGAVCRETGWLPAHCALRLDGRLVGAAPLYVKGHGLGEFVYDQLWADAAARLGLPYYPKLVAATPFTPVAGYRFLTDPGFPGPDLSELMLAGIDRLAQANGLTGLHALFCDDAFADELQKLGLVAWEHQAFVWENRGYGDFEGFLGEFRTGQRKNIRRERERLRESGVRVVVVDGSDAPDSWFALMHHYYTDTCDKFGEWGCKFLPESFFLGLPECCREHLAFSAAFESGREEPVGLALLAHGGDSLYGRYWGAARDIPFLHFELCYYAPIEWAISRGLGRFDPGMGGEHKPRRGFDSRPIRSMHRFHDPLLAQVFGRYVGQVNDLTREHIEDLQGLSAFKNPTR